MEISKTSKNNVAAIIAAAGSSQRMGSAKQLLPWGLQPVIRVVVQNIAAADVAPLVCVLGHRHDDVKHALQDTAVLPVYNPAHSSGELLSSYQVGVDALIKWEKKNGKQLNGALLALGDQPHIPAAAIKKIIKKTHTHGENIIFLSCCKRRGHPFYVPRHLWTALLQLRAGQTLRTLIRQHEQIVQHVTVDTEAILFDMDTLADYKNLLARFGHFET